MRRTLALVLTTLAMPAVFATSVSAQFLVNPDTLPTLLSQSQPAQPPTGAGPQDPKPGNPPAAIGEEGVKPTRNFLASLVYRLGDDVKHMPSWGNLAWLTGGGAVALALHQRDLDINSHFIGSNDAFWNLGSFLGQSATLYTFAGTTYIVGRVKDSNRIKHLGMDEIEALLLADGFVFAIKQTVRRDRPLTPEGEPQSGFSFPSGHATATFAAATVLQQHLGYKAGIPTYLFASYVAMSRLHDNKHFASDVAFGAALGIVIGRSVTWHGRHFYGAPMVVPGGAGVQFTINPGPR